MQIEAKLMIYLWWFGAPCQEKFATFWENKFSKSGTLKIMNGKKTLLGFLWHKFYFIYFFLFFMTYILWTICMAAHDIFPGESCGLVQTSRSRLLQATGTPSGGKIPSFLKIVYTWVLIARSWCQSSDFLNTKESLSVVCRLSQYNNGDLKI